MCRARLTRYHLNADEADAEADDAPQEPWIVGRLTDFVANK